MNKEIIFPVIYHPLNIAVLSQILDLSKIGSSIFQLSGEKLIGISLNRTFNYLSHSSLPFLRFTQLSFSICIICPLADQQQISKYNNTNNREYFYKDRRLFILLSVTNVKWNMSSKLI